MSKIICDVCGTRYPESAGKCPICGRVCDSSENSVADEMLMEDMPFTPSGSHVRGGRFSKSNVRKRNEGAASYEMPEQPRRRTRPQEQEEIRYGNAPVEQENKSNVGLNIALVVVIVALLCVTAYIFVTFFMPNVLKLQEATEPSIVPTEIVTEAPTTIPTEEPTIPCESLVWADGEPTSHYFEAAGEQWLLNTLVTPENTTDQIMYWTSDENVAIVDSEGCVTALANGEAVITVSCGSQQLSFQVVCYFADATEATTEPPTEATKPLKDVTLTVDKTDITFNAKDQGYTFKCGQLSRDEITWISEDESIVTVKDGKAVSVGKGTTNIIAKYGEQEVTIIVRCKF